MTKAYYTPRAVEDEYDVPGPCVINYFNGFDFWVTMVESGIQLIAQDDELTINGVTLAKLMEDGLVRIEGTTNADTGFEVISSEDD